MKSMIKRSLFIAISLTLAALTARRLREDREIEGSLDTPNRDKPSPPLPEPEHQQARALPQSPIRPASPMMAVPSTPADIATGPVLAVTMTPASMAAAPTVTFSGTVVRNGPRFALRETAGVLYPLDSAGRAWAYEGEDVRVTGKLDLNTRLLYVDAIEPSMPSMLETRLPDAV
jgi:hypothetical protein